MTSPVSENEASGGGIVNDLGTVTLASSAIVSDNNPNNCAGPTAVANCNG